MSRSRYRPRYRPEKPTGAPCRDLRRAEVEERGYERCEFVPLHGVPRVTRTRQRRSVRSVREALRVIDLLKAKNGGLLTRGARES